MRISLALLIGGILSGIVSSTLYYLRGYHHGILGLFLASLFLTGAYFFLKRTRKKSRFNKYDTAAVAILLLIFAPLYLAFIYTIPWQVGSDEVTIMITERNTIYRDNFDPFGISSYFGFPSLVFLTFGWLGKITGGIDLLHMRTIHAVSGLAVILLGYFLFRTGLSRPLSFVGAVILGSNHSLLAISRMAMRDNTGLLIEVAALTVLLIGLQRKCQFYTFLGGLIAGLSFYVYYPGRITIIAWFAFLAMTALFIRKTSFRELTKLGIIALLGFAMVANPIMLATVKAQDLALKFQREQLLIFPEGRELLKPWYATNTTYEGVKTNMIYGLTAFNNEVDDHGWIYSNYKHGFVDPLTGILIWIGLATILFELFSKRELQNIELLSVAGFLILWLLLSFVVGKSPNYTRLLVILPFVAVLVTKAIGTISNFTNAKIGKLRASNVLFALFVIIIFFWNLGILSDYVKRVFSEGNDIGGTARYIEERKGIANYTFYFAESGQYTYYVWGMKWHEFFVDPTQQSIIISPESAIESIRQLPFTIFTSESGWKLFENQTRNLYPNLNIQNIKADGSLLAIEVQ